MEDGKEEGTENPVGRQLERSGHDGRHLKHARDRRGAVGMEKTHAHRPSAGNGGIPGVGRRTVVDWAGVRGELNVEERHDDHEREPGSDGSQGGLLHHECSIL